MNPTLQARMLEATRLTRAGRLMDATVLIQQTLRGENPAPRGPSSAADPDSPPRNPWQRAPLTLDGTAERVADPNDRHQDRCQAGGPVEGGAEPAPAGPRPEPARVLHTLMDRLRRQAPQGIEEIRAGLEGLKRQTRSSTPPLPEGARFVEARYDNAAGSRDYKLYIPSGYRDQPLPLVVMLHGCTQNPDDFAAGTRMNQLAEEHGLLVVYPAQSRQANLNGCWNWFNAAEQRRDQGEPSLIAGIVARVREDYRVDPCRVYVAGLSAGGAMAAIMGATYPDLFAAVGIHSGLATGSAQDIPSAFAAMGRAGTTLQGDRIDTPLPTIVFHGDRDTTVHPDNGERIVGQWCDAMSGNGNAWQTREERGVTPGGHDHTCTRYLDEGQQVVLEQWRIHGAGHAWAGGSPDGSYTDPRGPDASAQMLRFFLEHRRGD